MSLARNTTYNLVGKLIPLAVALVTVPIYSHMIGMERYGILAICWGLLGYFGLFDMGLGTALSYRLSVLHDQPARSADCAWTGFVVSATMGAIGAVIFWFAAAGYFTHSLKATTELKAEILSGLPLLIASVPIAVNASVLAGALNGRQRFFSTNAVLMSSAILAQIAPLILAYFIGPNLQVVLWGAVGSRLLGAFGLLLLCRREYWRTQRPKVSLEEAKQLFRFGGWVTLNSILNPILALADRLMIGAALGAQSVAAYTVPYSLAERTSVLPYAFTSALFPKMSSQTDEERRLLERNSLIVLLAIMTPPIMIGVFLAQPFLMTWLGKTYDPRSAGVAQVLLMNFWAACFSLLMYVRLQAEGRPHLLTQMLVIQIPLYLVALYVGIHVFGVVGAAWALLARQLLNYVQASWLTNRRLVAWPHLTIGLAAMTILHFATGALSFSDWRLWTLGVFFCLGSVVWSWRSLPSGTQSMILRYLPPLRAGAA